MKNYFTTSHAILETKAWLALSKSAKILYQILLKHSNRYGDENGWFFRSSRGLATDTAINKSTISKALNELNTAHLINLNTPDQLDKGHAQQIQLINYKELKPKKKRASKKKGYVRKIRT